MGTIYLPYRMMRSFRLSENMMEKGGKCPFRNNNNIIIHAQFISLRICLILFTVRPQIYHAVLKSLMFSYFSTHIYLLIITLHYPTLSTYPSQNIEVWRFMQHIYEETFS